MPDAAEWTCFAEVGRDENDEKLVCGYRNRGHALQCAACGNHI